jgi:hypothetical protein
LISGSSRSETTNFEPPVYLAMPLAVAGWSCMSPIAPALERAFASNFDSCSITAASSAASRW